MGVVIGVGAQQLLHLRVFASLHLLQEELRATKGHTAAGLIVDLADHLQAGKEAADPVGVHEEVQLIENQQHVGRDSLLDPVGQIGGIPLGGIAERLTDATDHSSEAAGSLHPDKWGGTVIVACGVVLQRPGLADMGGAGDEGHRLALACQFERRPDPFRRGSQDKLILALELLALPCEPLFGILGQTLGDIVACALLIGVFALVETTHHRDVVVYRLGKFIQAGGVLLVDGPEEAINEHLLPVGGGVVHVHAHIGGGEIPRGADIVAGVRLELTVSGRDDGS